MLHKTKTQLLEKRALLKIDISVTVHSREQELLLALWEINYNLRVEITERVVAIAELI